MFIVFTSRAGSVWPVAMVVLSSVPSGHEPSRSSVVVCVMFV